MTITRGGARDPAMQAITVNGAQAVVTIHIVAGEVFQHEVAVPNQNRPNRSVAGVHADGVDCRDRHHVHPGRDGGAGDHQVIKRERERELRYDLWMIRDAIDRYKDAADQAKFQIKLGSEGYPPDLDTLVQGVDSNGKKLKFLRRIPVDPMTGKAEWGMRSMQDDPTSDSWGAKTCSTSIPSLTGRRSTAPNIRTGR